MPKLTNKPNEAFMTALKTAGYGFSYETNSGNVSYHRLPTKDADGNYVYNELPIDTKEITTIEKLADKHLEAPELSLIQSACLYAELDIDEHLPVLIKTIKLTDRKRAAKLAAQFSPARTLIYSKLYNRLQGLKAEMKVQFPTVDFDQLYSVTNLKSAWASALTLD